jgi:hypothetical protein
LVSGHFGSSWVAARADGGGAARLPPGPIAITIGRACDCCSRYSFLSASVTFTGVKLTADPARFTPLPSQVTR